MPTTTKETEYLLTVATKQYGYDREYRIQYNEREQQPIITVYEGNGAKLAIVYAEFVDNGAPREVKIHKFY